METTKKVRISKKHAVRKKEILDKAQILFTTKGYSKSTVNDILESVGIAKGTFYHYFKSKEEVMDALIMRFISFTADIIEQKINEKGKNAMEKLRDVHCANYRAIPGFEEIFLQLKYSDNAEMQYKIALKTIRKISPIYMRLIEQGIAEGIFKTEYPREFSEFMLVFSQFIFDNDMLDIPREMLAEKAKAGASFIERILGVKKGALDFLIQKYAYPAKIPLKTEQ